MKGNKKLLQLIEDTFTEADVKNIAYYIISSLAVGEAINMSFAMGLNTVESLPPQNLDIVYKYDSGLTGNPFFLQHYGVIKSMIGIDRVKMTASNELLRMAGEKDCKRCYEAVHEMFTSKLDSLILLTLLWKGYDFSVDFACKLKLVVDLPQEVKDYFKERIGD